MAESAYVGAAMKALVVAPGGLEVSEVADPHAEPDGVVVEVHSCGICGSDVHWVEIGRGASGHILGHEFAGTIAEVGSKVDGWRPGQPVAVNPLGGCGACHVCRRGVPFLCERLPNLGLTAPGGFAEFVAVPEKQLVALPDGLDLELGAHAEPLAVALHAIALAEPSPGDDALVFGVGPIGLNVIGALRAAGAGKIVAVGRSEGRRSAAAALGADVVLDSRETSLAEYARANGVAFAQAFECSAAPEAVADCASVLAVGGTLVEVALPDAPPAVPVRSFVTRSLRLVGSCAYGPEEYRRAVQLLSRGELDVRPLVSERVPLSGAPDAFRRLRRPENLVGVLVQPWL